MGKWFFGDAVGFDGAAKSVPGPSAGAARVKVDSACRVESSRRWVLRVAGLQHAMSTRP